MTPHHSDPGHSSRRRRHDHHARKERVLHTRISEQLSEDIRNFAEDLRVPVSNLVRNVLEEVFTVVSSVSDDVGDLFDDLIEEAEEVRERVRNQAASGPRRRRGRHDGQHDNQHHGDPDRPRAADLFPDILGWQPLVLNRDFECGRCTRSLVAGESAFLGLGENGLTQTALCGRCAGSR